MRKSERIKQYYGNYNFLVFRFLVVFIIAWVFTTGGVAQGNDETMIESEIENNDTVIISEAEEESAEEMPSSNSRFDPYSGEWVQNENLLHRLWDDTPPDPITLISRDVNALRSDIQYLYYGLVGMAFIAVILVIRNSVWRHKALSLLDKSDRNIRKINNDSIKARRRTGKTDEICRELSNLRLTAAIGDLVRAKQTVDGVTDTLNVTAKNFQKTLKGFENDLEEIAETHAARLLKYDEILR